MIGAPTSVCAERELSPAFASLSTAQRHGGRKAFGLKEVTPGVFVSLGSARDKREASKRLTGYGTWKCVRRMEDGSATEPQGRRAEEEMGWLVSNNWLTMMATPLPVFLKVFIPKGFKFFRKNTCRSVDSAWFIGALSLDNGNN